MVLLLCLLGCHPTPVVNASSSIKPVKGVTQSRQLPPYNQVQVKGHINISLHTGYRRPQVILRGDPRDLQQVITLVENRQLLIKVGEGYPKYGQIAAEVRTQQLNSFSYDGYGTVMGPKLYSKSLTLSINNAGNTQLGGTIYLTKLTAYDSSNIKLNGVRGFETQIIMIGNPRIELSGVINLGTLDLRGNGFLSAYWLKNKHLTIREHGNISIQLAGFVNFMEVELWDNAQFNGQYLRANRAFVKTHDHSMAKISAVRRQHTLASDASDIYFYNLPETRADFMAFNGAVLDMRDWNLFSEQEYTAYNN